MFYQALADDDDNSPPEKRMQAGEICVRLDASAKKIDSRGASQWDAKKRSVSEKKGWSDSRAQKFPS